MKNIKREGGQALILVALSMTMLLGFAGFATDVGVLLHVKREAQTAADAAAIAGATEALAEGNPTTLSTTEYNAAEADASLNGFTGASSSGAANTSTGTTLTVNVAPNITVPTFNLPGYVQVTISQPAPTVFIKAFMSLFGNTGYSGMTVGASAIASDTIKSQGCFYVTDLTGDSPSFDISTGSNNVITTKCGVYVNGNLDIGGSSSITSSSVVATGSISGGSGITGAQAAGVPPQPIPLPQLLLPADQPTINTTAGTCTAPPNSGFSACFLNAPLTGNLAPGLYVFTQTPVFGSSISGSDVTIYLSGSFPYNDGNSSINISGPTSGPFSQVVFDAPTDSPGSGFGCPKGNSKNNVAGVLHMNFGSSSTAYNGIVYAPYAHLFTQDQGASNGNINTDLVIGTVCGESATFEVSGLTNASPITQVGLVY